MESDNQSQNPTPANTEAQTPYEQPPEQFTTQKPKSKKKIILIVSLVVLILAAGAAAYFLTKEDKQSETPAPTAAKLETKKDGTLAYVTKLDKTATVQIKNIAKDTVAKEVSFAEKNPVQPENGSYSEYNKPSATLSPDGLELAYISDDNLIVRNIAADKEETIIKKTGSKEGDVPIISVEPALPKVGGPGLSSLMNPKWSSDGQNIGVHLGFYEGGAVQVINRATKKYASLGDTFRYISEDSIPDSAFTLLPENKALIPMGLYGEYVLKESTYLTQPTISTDSKKVLALLCPLNLPTTGNSTYLESAFSAADLKKIKNQRDCGEAGDLSFISIELTNGAYKEIGTGKFGLTFAQTSDGVYLSGSNSANYKVTKISLSSASPSSTLDIKSLAGLGSGDTVEHANVHNAGLTPVAEIYIKNGGKYSVKVINLQTEKLVTSIDLEPNMSYATLGLSQ